MTASTFRVVFSGEALPGFNQNIAIDNLAKLIKRTPEQVRSSFNGQATVIKKGLTAAEAERYCQALGHAGLTVHAEQDPGAPTGAVATPENPAPAAESKLALTLVPIEDENQAAVPTVPTVQAESVPVAAISTLTLVPIEDDDHQAAASAVRTEMICPACGHKQLKAEICDACGTVIAKFSQRQSAKPGDGK